MPEQMRFASALASESDFKKAATEIGASIERQLGMDPIDLVLVFASSHFAGPAHELLARLRDALSPRALVGCTGEGVIGPEREVEGEAAIAVVAARLPDVDIRSFSFLPEEIRDIAEESRKLPYIVNARQDTKAFLLLGDPFSALMDGLLKAFNETYQGVPVIGGMTSGAGSPGEAALLLNDHTYRVGAVGVAMSGAIEVDSIVSQGCRPIGPPLTVTGAEANIIKFLDEKPAMAHVQEVVEELTDEDRALLQNGLFVGRAIDSSKEMFGRGDFLIRGVVGIDRKSGAIAIGDFIEDGETVQFHLRDAATAEEDLELMLTPHSLFGTPSGAFLFSCNGRGTKLYDHPNGDISAINGFFKGMPVAGFFCAGEIGPIGGKNFLHGHTASLALIRPAARAKAS
jgi:small ligand-binding sensory domain FIST